MPLSQIDETDGNWFYVLARTIGDRQTLYVHLGEEDGFQLVYTICEALLATNPPIAVMMWDEPAQSGFVRVWAQNDIMITGTGQR